VAVHGQQPDRTRPAFLPAFASTLRRRLRMSQANVPNPVASARANYAQFVTSFVSPYDWRMAHQEGELRD